MDNVSELTARAAAYIVLLQDAWAQPPLADEMAAAVAEIEYEDEAAERWVGSKLAVLHARIKADAELQTRALALVASTICLDGEAAPTTLRAQWLFFQARTWHLLDFVREHIEPDALKELFAGAAPRQPADDYLLKRWPPVWESTGALLSPMTGEKLLPPGHRFLPPEQWRRALRRLLYASADHRVHLAEALSYLPTLLFSLLHGRPPGARKQAKHSAAPDGTEPWKYYLKRSDRQFAEDLAEAQLAVPFELVFGQELHEIDARRASHQPKAPVPTPAPPRKADPQLHADELGLCALAFSGGGIRSATFNLGLLQGLARAGWLPRFDYLSTVSGGGYLGSWLAAWIKREGSLRKVADRLCPDKAPVPNAEEVRPMRWLRMYSNYLAPSASFFSTDAWTLGITWLRNTLLNQLIIVLALGGVLALGNALLTGWFRLAWSAGPAIFPSLWQVGCYSVGLLVAGTIIASLGMRMYWATPAPLLRKAMLGLVSVLQAIAFGGAYLVSGFFYNACYPGFGAGCLALWPAAAVAAAMLMAVAITGRYHRCFHRIADPNALKWFQIPVAWLAIIGSSLGGAAAGLAGLVGAWKVLATLHTSVEAAVRLADTYQTVLVPRPWLNFSHYSQVLLYAAFILGVPLLLETVVLTVVARMALLGRNFPDERREWWGRIGAAVHLAMLVWVVLASSTLLARAVAWQLPHAPAELAAAGGWLGLVGGAVRLAFSARTQAQPDQPGAASWLDRLLSLAPYLFGLGLLLLVAGSLYHVLHDWPFAWNPDLSWLASQWTSYSHQLVARALALGVLLGVAALLLGWRVGVNEFSLHHFYRNRLVRAYLGASRPRFKREHEANPFTNFTPRDDIKLATLRRHAPPSKEADGPAGPYEGPYLLLNATLNATKITDLAQQSRMAESFVFTPLYCGFDFARVRALKPNQPTFEFGYRPTAQYADPDGGPSLGTAMTISGAAANPNEGYHSSPAMAFLLTLFNVRLGWWMGNPSHAKTWTQADPARGLFYLLSDLFGRSTTGAGFVNLSDGGHFDNMGLYELVRRRCRYIILGDGEEDHLFTCDGLANAIRRCRVDFGVEITIDVTPITNRQAGYSRRHYAVGTIRYPEDLAGQPSGYLLYIKSSLTGDEPTDVREYAQTNASFPHQSTADQFFSEAQFESYRRLGLHIFETLQKQCPVLTNPPQDLKKVFQQLATTCAKPAADEAARPQPAALLVARNRRLLLPLASQVRRRD